MGNRAFGLAVLLTLGAGAPLLPACASKTNEASDAGANDATSSGSTVVTGSGFATSCSTDDDCVGAHFGDVCGLCSTDLANASIASSAEAAYQNALNAAQSRCPPLSVNGFCAINQTITTCASGTCTLTTCSGGVASAHACKSTNDAGDAGADGASSSGSTVVTGSGLATSCSTDDDCVGVYFGDVCGLCATDIPNAAIASSAETAYQNALNAAQSRCPPNRGAGSCDAGIAGQTITACAMGTCRLTTCSESVASAHACASTNDAGDAGTDT